ncbi:sensor histidine kinase [Planosporangium mesophilum]|uniref:histidine kinase n=1 Tax=Planosporangium mesophilum TaxID=689768 RepID=A0A8J3X1W5_9ACTN|nr:ATP-binding protein [Planosporangium mesophilum]NJC82396.1 HAMP domain-containing protein [Planosporangium mesophilum]GII24860.1 two-component sensor histidine kinase [Planosporangium mesophilum]
MSFRLRALALIMLVAVAATSATAWLTLRQVSRQVRESVAAGQEETAAITAELRAYGQSHATWAGLEHTVAGLASRTGQRIRVVTDTGVLLADSDLLSGRAARQVVGVPVLVDARPTLRLPESGTPTALARLTIGAIHEYRTGAPYAACLTRAGIPVTASPRADGVPTFTVAGNSTSAARECPQQPPPEAEARDDNSEVLGCVEKAPDGVRQCLARAFADRVAGVAPPPLQVYLGAVGDTVRSLRLAPTLLVALAVAVAAIVGALLLSRGVLRPVRALIDASGRVGAGELGRRVPVSGRDEIAQLGRAFNRMADSLQASEERQRRLTADIAHELRTPLANLRGYLEALRDGVVEPTPQLVSSLHEEVLLQQRIVEDLQDLALAETGALTYHRTEVDLDDLLATCVTTHRGAAESVGVGLGLWAQAQPRVDADPDRLRQVVGNLITNAVRATSPGGRVEVHLSQDKEAVVIRVRDTGTGIPADDLPHLFDRFWRADAARGRTTGGSGLGLAIARQIVTDHAGTIDVASTVGVGTAFTIRLPLPSQAAAG